LRNNFVKTIFLYVYLLSAGHILVKVKAIEIEEEEYSHEKYIFFCAELHTLQPNCKAFIFDLEDSKEIPIGEKICIQR